MLREHGIEFEYREYRENPLSVDELRVVLGRLRLGPHDVLRRHDRAAKELGLTGEEPAERLIELMAAHPTLLQRPIGVTTDRAVLGRPPESLLALLE